MEQVMVSGKVEDMDQVMALDKVDMEQAMVSGK